MNNNDILDLELFDTPEWTRALDAMSLGHLALIQANDKFREELRRRVTDACTALKAVFEGKDDLVDLVAVCTIARLPLLLLGTWGTGKSMLIRKFTEALGIEAAAVSIREEDALIAEMGTGSDAVPLGIGDRRHFEYLVTRFTTPEEILGSVDVDLMLKRSIHARVTRGLLPRAEIAFLDEVFKANSSILNALLSIMNERIYYNAGVPWKANLLMLFGASNEPPQEDDLGAFYDRFPVRALCDPVDSDPDALLGLLRKSHLNAFAAVGANRDIVGAQKRPLEPSIDLLEKTKVRQLSCPNDFRLLGKLSMIEFGAGEVSGGRRLANRATPGGPVTHAENFTRTFLQTFQHLRHAYDISDRSMGHFYRLARALAYFHGRTELSSQDCIVFSYAFKDPTKGRQLKGVVRELIGV